MRLEINIADERPEAKILGSVSDPSAFVLDLVLQAGRDRRITSPDYFGSIAKVRQSPNRFQNREEIDSYIHDLRAEW